MYITGYKRESFNSLFVYYSRFFQLIMTVLPPTGSSRDEILVAVCRVQVLNARQNFQLSSGGEFHARSLSPYKKKKILPCERRSGWLCCLTLCKPSTRNASWRRTEQGHSGVSIGSQFNLFFFFFGSKVAVTWDTSVHEHQSTNTKNGNKLSVQKATSTYIPSSRFSKETKKKGMEQGEDANNGKETGWYLYIC